MKYLGFIKEHDNIQEAILFKKMLLMPQENEEEINRITTYLKKGKIVFGWMGYFDDLKTQKSVAPHAYYTDGIWVWPSYLPYYLEAYLKLYIDAEFIQYLTDKGYVFELHKNTDLKIAENELSEKLTNKS